MEFLKGDNGFEWEGAEVIGEVEADPSSASAFQLVEKHQEHQKQERQRQKRQRRSQQRSQQPPTAAGGMLDSDRSNWGPEELAAYALLRSKRKKCVVTGCTSRSIPLARSYHQLPVRNLEVWQKWVEAIRWCKNEPDWLPSTDQPLVCSRHFHPEMDFISYEGSSRSRLNHTAIPSLYIDPPEGTVMNTKFELDRPPPKYVAYAKRHRSDPPDELPLVQPIQATSGMANKNNGRKQFVVPKSELMEVTPQFNFEEVEDASEYDGEGAFDQEEVEEDEEMDGYEEQISYGNVGNGISRSQTTGMYYDETEEQEEEPEDIYYAQPQRSQSLGNNYRNQQQQQQTKVVPKLSISSLLEKYSENGRNKNQNQYQQQQQLPRILSRPSSNNNYESPGSSRGVNVNNGNRGMPSIKIERIEGNSNGFQVPRKILMKVPPARLSGGDNNTTTGAGDGGGPTQKHKIGMSKCRLIVESIERELEEQLQAIKVKVAQEMGVPTQVVHGVWQIKDKIKKGTS